MMTSEILIMNKESVALAADSAGTLTSEKIYTSFNKIYVLSKTAPVGCMIYNHVEFMGVPWETVIKLYRNNLGDKKFSTLVEYDQDFKSFLVNYFSEEYQVVFFKIAIIKILNLIRSRIEELKKNIFQYKGAISPEELMEILTKVIEKAYNFLSVQGLNSSLSPEDGEKFRALFKETIDENIANIYGEFNISDDLKGKLFEITISSFTKCIKNQPNFFESGVIITGFGEEEIFPSYSFSTMNGVFNGKLMVILNNSHSINLEIGAVIRPFAQHEMVDTFMEGIDPNYKAVMDSYHKDLLFKFPKSLLDIIERKLVEKGLITNIPHDIKREFISELETVSEVEFKKNQKKFSDYRLHNHINIVINVVQALPKDELAAMAESLISLTSFKRRVSMQAPTVGGPIDVAVISKKDGFIWIKRKHYFDPDLNSDYFNTSPDNNERR